MQNLLRLANPRARLFLRIIGGGVAVLFLLMVVCAVVCGYFAYSAYRHVASLEARISVMDVEGARDDVVGLRRDLGVLSTMSTPVLAMARPLPWVGVQVQAVQELRDGGLRTLDVVQDLFVVGDAVLAPLRDRDGGLSQAGVTPDQRYAALQALAAHRVTLASVSGRLALARLSFGRVSDGGVSPSLLAVRDRLDVVTGKAIEVIDEALPRVEAVLALIGSPEEKTYLFLLQNNTEVRATGGFIGNYGIMKVAKGDITSFFTDNVYNLDDPVAKTLQVAPPAPIAKYFKTDRWFFRDSNWSPDFPTAAREAERFYGLEGGKEQLDGVIAMTPDVIIRLLALTGPIVVEGVTYRAENFNEQLQYQVEHGFYQRGIPVSQRKEVVGVLAKIMMDRLVALPPRELPKLLQVITASLDEKHILAYSDDVSTQQLLSSVAWTGEVRKDEGDFVMVIDSNMLAQKTDQVMDKTISYRLTETESGEINARLILSYRNNGMFSPYITRYRDWVRVYVPAGATLISSSGAMEVELSDEVGRVEVYPELGRTVFAAYIVVEPGKTKDLVLNYRLPASLSAQIKAGAYRLTAQKQSGVQSQVFAGEFLFRQPIVGVGGADVAAIADRERSRLTWITDLHIDRGLEVAF